MHPDPAFERNRGYIGNAVHRARPAINEMEATENDRLVRMLRDTAAGDAQAFEQLYASTSPLLYGIALKMLRSRTAADDVLQDAFVQVWHRAGDYHAERGNVMSWLASILRYRAIDVLRKNRRDTPLDKASMDETSSAMQRFDDPAARQDEDDTEPLRSAMAVEDSDYLDLCMSRLSGSQKQSIALAFFHGLTHSELAECLATPLGTIKSRLRRSLQRLKECLGKLGYRDEIPTGSG